MVRIINAIDEILEESLKIKDNIPNKRDIDE